MPRISINEHVSQFRYCRIIPTADTVAFSYKGIAHELHFSSPHFETGSGVLVRRCSDSPPLGHIEGDLLLWLLVFFGEDLVAPHQEVDTRFIFMRGDFRFESRAFLRFIRACERFPSARLPAWRRALFRRALAYLSAAVRGGLEFMPLNLGFFGMCLETMGISTTGAENSILRLANFDCFTHCAMHSTGTRSFTSPKTERS
jgi:hypothetical protein